MGNFPSLKMGLGLGEKEMIWLLGREACYSIEDIKPEHESKFSPIIYLRLVYLGEMSTGLVW
jgi:hypothetical protein